MNDQAYTGPRDPINCPANAPATTPQPTSSSTSGVQRTERSRQLELEIETARHTLDGNALVEHIIKLYAAELEKANEAIHRLTHVQKLGVTQFTLHLLDLLNRIRPVLKRWTARYAGSDHAKKAVIESAKLIEEIDALPKHAKD